MAEIWGAAIMVVGGIASGIAAEKKAKADRKAAKEDKAVDYNKVAQETGYEAALDHYYTQKDKFEQQRGLDQYRNFSTITNYAPGAQKYDGQLTDPVMPNYKDFEIPEDPKTSNGGSSSNFSDKVKKVDPLGGALLGGLGL